MPANLTKQYLRAEAAYRRASTPEEELECLQVMLRELPKHKGTEKLQSDLRQRIRRARLDAAAPKKSRATLRIPRQGAGRAVLIGGPNVGKSQFMATVTRADPEVAEYPFTTREPAPAMMPFEDIFVQLIDTPCVTADYADDCLWDLVRGADLVLLMADLSCDEGIEQLVDVVGRFADGKTRLGRTTCFDENDVGVSYTRTLLVLTKSDAVGFAERRSLLDEFCPTDFDTFAISTLSADGLDSLKSAIFNALEVVRVYTKAPNAKQPDMEKPFTVPRGGTLRDVADLIHKDLKDRMRHARVWGANVHDGAIVKSDYVLHDQDIVEIHAGANRSFERSCPLWNSRFPRR